MQNVQMKSFLDLFSFDLTLRFPEYQDMPACDLMWQIYLFSSPWLTRVRVSTVTNVKFKKKTSPIVLFCCKSKFLNTATKV